MTAPGTPRRWGLASPAIAAALLLAAWMPGAEGRIIHREQSMYSTILVNQQGSVRCMQFSVRRDQRNQSCINERRPREMIFDYARMMMASLLLNPEPRRILVLGLGGGTLPMALDELLPEARIDVVEIDPAVVRVAREYFSYAPSDRVDVYAQDGRVFVKRAARQGERYDLVMLDAFNGEYIPEHLMTREFLAEVRSLLADDGVLAANTFSLSTLYDHESATYADVFGEFFNLKPGSSGNRVILDRKGGLPDRETLRDRAERLQPRLDPYGVELGALIRLMSTEVDWDDDARLLTDQYSPVNLLQEG